MGAASSGFYRHSRGRSLEKSSTLPWRKLGVARGLYLAAEVSNIGGFAVENKGSCRGDDSGFGRVSDRVPGRLPESFWDLNSFTSPENVRSSGFLFRKMDVGLF